MEAADESKRRGGAEVRLKEIFDRVGYQTPTAIAP
jgi:hypothetical protein